MRVLFFGQYLIEAGLITAVQLRQAVALQRATNIRLGELAVSVGLLSIEQASHINQLQNGSNKRFGDLAIEQSLLTEQQMSSLLDQQLRQRQFIGGVLVQQGILSQAQLERALALHQQRTQQALQPLDELIYHHPSGHLLALAITLCKNIFLRIMQRNCTFSCLVKNLADTPIALTHCVRINASGGAAFTLALATNEQTMLRISSRYAGIAPADTQLEFAKATFGELLDTIVSQMLDELASKGGFCERSAADSSVGVAALMADDESSLLVEMGSELGSFVLLVSRH